MGRTVPSVAPCCRYQSAKDPSYVDYMRFSDEVESIFTRKDLEKTPTADVQQFIPPVEVNMNVLSPEEEQILQKTMHRLAERVRGGMEGLGGEGMEEGMGERGGGGTTCVTIGITTCINWCRFVFVMYRYFHCLKTMTEYTLAVSPAPR